MTAITDLEKTVSISQTQPARGDGTRAPSRTPRIYAINPLLAGAIDTWSSLFDHIAGLGFDHVLLPPPFQPGRSGDLFKPADLDRLHPTLGWSAGADDGLREMARQADGSGIRLILDVVPDRLSADSPLVRSRPDLFRRPDDAAALDPRIKRAPFDTALAALESSDLLSWWAERLERWSDAGVSGFRFASLATLPPAMIAALAADIRQRAPGVSLLGWTPGMSRPAILALEPVGLDFVFSSLPWWNLRSEWIWGEAETLSRVGALIAAPEAPFGRRLAAAYHDPSVAEAAYRRAVALACGFGPGWLMPMGFEYGAERPLDSISDRPDDWARVRADAVLDLGSMLSTLNAARAADPAIACAAAPRPLTGPGSPIVAYHRLTAADPRAATRGFVVALNARNDSRAAVPAGTLLAAFGTIFPRLDVLSPTGQPPVAIGDTIALEPGEAVMLSGAAAPPRSVARLDLVGTATFAANEPRAAIEAITPAVDGGAFPVKRIVGDVVDVEADVIIDGHDITAVVLLWRRAGASSWQERRMEFLTNDRWQGRFPLTDLGRFEFAVEAWRDAFGTWRDEVRKKHAAGVDTTLELQEGLHHVTDAAARASGDLRSALDAIIGGLPRLSKDEQRTVLLSPETKAAMATADPRPGAVRSPTFEVQAERSGASFASWYEIFPRSMSDDESRHGTFDDVIRHLPRIRDMGFDVLYFPPIHPIGRTNRKGRNNSLTAAPEDPGSPYAIGSAEGGHEALHPQLGSFDDFRRMREAASAHGLEIAIDFAIQCSPDHPWLREHKGWFAWRPDGTIKFAENPPKKYEDIVNVDFYAKDALPDLWIALCEVVMLWASQGVRLFRVDNPHTKPLPFWEWMIAQVQAVYPDAIFLAEAFTRPKVMYRLAKVGFSQSYTYFTWRNTKQELQAYLTELDGTAPRDFFRPHFFVNTPDINPIFLQTSGRPGFLIRAALAATLSGLWGVYCGFELCEGTPVRGKEEYLDSEKYQLRAWDWDRPGNIVPEITRLNEIRRLNPALHTHLGIRFHAAFNDQIVYFSKATPDRSNVILCAISLDPSSPQEADFEVPLWDWNLPDNAAVTAEDLVRGGTQSWYGKMQRLRLDPASPYSIWRVRPV